MFVLNLIVCSSDISSTKVMINLSASKQYEMKVPLLRSQATKQRDYRAYYEADRDREDFDGLIVALIKTRS
jgi:hypothetical protein